MEYKKLGDICDILNGYAFKSDKYVESGIRIIRISNVQKGYIEDKTPAFYPINTVDIEKYMLSENDLLISLTGNVGRVALLDKKFLPSALNQRVACIRTKTDIILKEYLFYMMNSDFFENQCIQSSRGVAQKNMSTVWLENYEVPIYPKEVQLKIVRTLSMLMDIIACYHKQLEKYDELIKARFVEMFGDVKNEEKYKGIALKNICKTMSGGTPSTKNPEYYSGQIPWITTISLGDNYIDGNDAKGYITQQAIDNSATKLVPKDSILFGTRVGVGKSSINEVEMCTNQDIVAIINVDKNKYNNLFIKNVLDAYQPYYDSLKKGATILGITSDDLKNTLIPIVSLNLQNQFADFVKQIDKSKFVVQKSLDKAQLLFDSLMQEYFG